MPARGLALLLLSFGSLIVGVVAVLRFPDLYYDVRWPLHFTDCESNTLPPRDPVTGDERPPPPNKKACYNLLRENMLEDLNCTAILLSSEKQRSSPSPNFM